MAPPPPTSPPQRRRSIDPSSVTVLGALDHGTAARAAFELVAASGTTGDILLDLNAVAVINLSGLDVLLTTAADLHERGMDVRVTPGWAEDALRLTGRWPLAQPLEGYLRAAAGS